MSDEPENLLLVYLRGIDTKIDGLAEEVRELKERISSVEMGVIGLHRDYVNLAETVARRQASIDRIRDDIARIKRRLDISDPPN